nr:pentatricopeptide repeat protein AaPPR865 [Agave angustifolia]
MFVEMLKSTYLRPACHTFSYLVKACERAPDVVFGEAVHGQIRKMGFGREIVLQTELIDFYSYSCKVEETRRVFDEMAERDVFSWNSMIFGYSNHGACDKAIQLFYQMEAKGVMRDHLTFTAIFTACSHAGLVELGKNLFRLMQDEHRIEPRLEHYACMVDLLGRAGKLDEAYELIQGMPMKPDSFVRGALLGACRKHGNVKLAEIAASHLHDLEPQSSGSSVILSNVLIDAGRWSDAWKIDKLMRKQKLKRYLGCSWVQDGQYTQ